MSADGSAPARPEGAVLLSIARGAIAERFGGPHVTKPTGRPWLDEPRAVFVTLKQIGRAHV